MERDTDDKYTKGTISSIDLHESLVSVCGILLPQQSNEVRLRGKCISTHTLNPILVLKMVSLVSSVTDT